MRRCTVQAANSISSISRPSMMRSTPAGFATSDIVSLPSLFTQHRGISRDNTPRIGNKRQVKVLKTYNDKDVNPLGKSIDEICAGIDTTLTPAQQTYVDMLKKKISGGALSQRVRCE